MYGYESEELSAKPQRLAVLVDVARIIDLEVET
jgi:hypothetical protein